MKRSSDAPLTFALCASLVVHALLVVLVVRERIAVLSGQLKRPPLVEALPERKEEEDVASSDAPPPQIIQSPSTELSDELAAKPPLPLPPPEVVKPKAKDIADENSEWGERDKTGFAITSAPGKQPMSARKGVEDQSFASRDPEGAAREFPDEPSPSVMAPGQNGDGGKPLRDALAGKGTEGEPAELLVKPSKPATPPPPPLPQRTMVATAIDPAPAPETSGPSNSQLPAPERRSPAEVNRATAERDGLPNDGLYGESNQMLPMKSPNVIGVRSPQQQAYPEVVAALTRPPGLKWTPERADPLDAPALANLVPADVTAAPLVQPATAALSLPVRDIEEMARLLGESDPRAAPPVVEAMLFPPGATPREGGEAPLPELALAEVVAGPEVREAITALIEPERQPDEPAEIVVPAVAAFALPLNTQVASAASATGGLPGPAVQAADPAPDTGLESDPFAKIPGVEFRNGKVEARSGRQVKPIRPHLTEAGKRDLLSLQFPTVTYRVRIDKTGKVTDVNVVHGSGSEAIDMPVYRSLWNWWFEPPRDRKGNPLEDVQLVTIHWG